MYNTKQTQNFNQRMKNGCFNSLGRNLQWTRPLINILTTKSQNAKNTEN